MNTCATCGSNEPHLHPAMNCGGEVELCTDSFHLVETAQNKPEYIEAVKAKQITKENQTE